MNLITVSTFFCQAVLTLGALMAVGYLVRRLIAHISKVEPPVVIMPLLGVYPVVQISWLWSYYFDSGLAVILPIMFAASALCAAALFFRQTESKRRGELRAFMHASVLVIVVFIAYAFIYRNFFTLDYVTPVSMMNNDSASISIFAEHLRRHGFGSEGNVFGADLGALVKSDTVGTFVLHLLPATLLDRDVWQTAQSTLFIAWCLVALQLEAFARAVLRVSRPTAFVIAVIAAVAPLTIFILANGYLSQLFAMALLFALFSIAVVPLNARRSVLSAMLNAAVLVAALAHVYSFLAFAAVPLVLAVRCLAYPLPILRTALWSAIAGSATLAVAGLLAIGRFGDAYHQTLSQGASSAGWPLPAFSLLEVLGLTTTFEHVIRAHEKWLASAALLLLVALAVALLRRNAAARAGAAVIAVGMLSYVVMYNRSGASYQQWKWLSLLAPLLMACILALGALVVAQVVSKLGERSILPTVFCYAVGAGSATLFGILLLMNTTTMTAASFRLDDGKYVRADLAALKNESLIREQRQLALRTDGWEGMWLASMLPDKSIRFATYFGYYPMALDDQSWVVQRAGQQWTNLREVVEQPLNGRYEAARFDSTQAAEIELANRPIYEGNDVTVSVLVHNLGSGMWKPAAVDPVHGLSLRAGFARRETSGPLGDGETLVAIRDEVGIVSLPAEARMGPGASVPVLLTVEAPAGDHVLTFDLVDGQGNAFFLWASRASPTVGPAN